MSNIPPPTPLDPTFQSVKTSIGDTQRQALAAMAQYGSQGLADYQAAQDQIKQGQQQALNQAISQSTGFGAPAAAGQQMAGNIDSAFGQRLAGVQANEAAYGANQQAQQGLANNYFSQAQTSLPFLQNETNIKGAQLQQAAIQKALTDQLTQQRLVLENAKLQQSMSKAAAMQSPASLGLDTSQSGDVGILGSLASQNNLTPGQYTTQLGGTTSARDVLGGAQKQQEQQALNDSTMSYAQGSDPQYTGNNTIFGPLGDVGGNALIGDPGLAARLKTIQAGGATNTEIPVSGPAPTASTNTGPTAADATLAKELGLVNSQAVVALRGYPMYDFGTKAAQYAYQQGGSTAGFGTAALIQKILQQDPNAGQIARLVAAEWKKSLGA